MTHGLQLTNRVTDKHTAKEAPVNEAAAGGGRMAHIDERPRHPHGGNGETAAGKTVGRSSGDAAGLGWRELGGESAPFFFFNRPELQSGRTNLSCCVVTPRAVTVRTRLPLKNIFSGR